MVLLSLETSRPKDKEGKLYRSHVTLTLRDASFSTITRSVTGSYTNSTEDIYNIAKRLLHSNWDGRIPLRLLGISLSQLVKEFEQVSLFNNDVKRKIKQSYRRYWIVSVMMLYLGLDC